MGEGGVVGVAGDGAGGGVLRFVGRAEVSDSSRQVMRFPSG